MTQEMIDYVTEKTQNMMAAPSCCAEAKAAAQAWLDAVGTEKEQEITRAYVAELEADITPIDGLIAFASSEEGITYFGGEMAKGLLAHAQQIKATGAKFCDCPACTAALAILDRREHLQ